MSVHKKASKQALKTLYSDHYMLPDHEYRHIRFHLFEVSEMAVGYFRH